MKNLKRFLAMGLAVTMVLGSSLTVFATETETPTEDTGEATSGTLEGEGSTEGHIDKHVIHVTLPVVSEDDTTFDYTVDPERLVDATDGSKYDVDFTDDAKTNGVYFLTSVAETEDKYDEVAADATFNSEETYYTYDEDFAQYSPESNLTGFVEGTTYYTKTLGTAAGTLYDSKIDGLTATSESSDNVKLTVKVAASDDANIELVSEAPSTTEATASAQLYLALMVGDKATPIVAGETVSTDVTIAGVPGNFAETYNDEDEEYQYAVRTATDENPLAEWGSASFYLTGVASNADAKELTVPTLTVTWEFEDPADGPTASSTTLTSAALSVTISGLADGVTLSKVVMNKTDGSTVALTSGKHYSYTDGTFKILTDVLVGSTYYGAKVVLTFSDDSTVTLTVAEK